MEDEGGTEYDEGDQFRDQRAWHGGGGGSWRWGRMAPPLTPPTIPPSVFLCFFRRGPFRPPPRERGERVVGKRPRPRWRSARGGDAGGGCDETPLGWLRAASAVVRMWGPCVTRRNVSGGSACSRAARASKARRKKKRRGEERRGEERRGEERGGEGGEGEDVHTRGIRVGSWMTHRRWLHN